MSEIKPVLPAGSLYEELASLTRRVSIVQMVVWGFGRLGSLRLSLRERCVIVRGTFLRWLSDG